MNNNSLNLEEYKKTNWLDEVCEYKRRFNMTKNNDGTIDLERVTGDIVQRGTPKNQKHMNNIEDGIYINREALRDLTDRVIYLEIQSAINDALLGMPNDNTFKEYFTTIDWCQVNRGIVDNDNKCIILNEYNEESDN